MHQNVRFAQFKKNLIEVAIEEINPDVLVLTELALYEHEAMNTIYKGMKLITGYFRSEDSNRGEGIGIFANQESQIEEIKINSRSRVCEMECVKMKNNKGNDVLLLGIYRPPQLNNFDEFLHLFTETLVELTDVNIDIVIVGDLNVDKIVESKQRNELLDIIECFQLSQKVKVPTRICKTKASCLDHVY